MSEIQNVQVGPKCEAIGCSQPLGYFDIKNGSRFCHGCRSNAYSVLRWKCKGCDAIISASRYRETKKYCDKCRGLSVEII